MQETICLRGGHHQLTIDLSPGKERGFTLKVQNHLKKDKKTLDKFEIIRKLETIRTQLTNIKNSLVNYYFN
jgi:hypothetical protein